MKAKDKVKMPEVLPEVQPLTREDKLHHFLETVQDKVVSLIDNNTLQISRQKVPFLQTKETEPLKINQRLKKLQENRQKMQSQIQYMTAQERQLRLKQRSLEKSDESSNQLRPSRLREKSELSQQDISVLRRLKREHREFERSLDLKTQQYQQMLLKLKKQKQQLFQKQKQQNCELKRKQIAKKLQQNQQARMRRMQQFEEEKRKLVELKTKKKLFEQMERAQKQFDRAQVEKKMALMQQRIRDKQVDLQTIREHQEKYRQMKEQRKMERQRRKQQFESIAKDRRSQLSAYQKSKYYTINVKETRLMKQKFREKEKQRQSLVQAAREYAELVKRNYVPTVGTKTISEQSHEPKVERMSFEEIKEVGNMYMQQMRANLKKGNVKNGSNLSSDETARSVLQGTSSTKYKDYLSERRRLRSNVEQKMSRTQDSRIRDRKILRELDRVHKIMSSDENKIEKLQKIRDIASKLQVQRNGEDFQMLDKISAKIRILQTLAAS